jgi:hypothetical protein
VVGYRLPMGIVIIEKVAPQPWQAAVHGEL